MWILEVKLVPSGGGPGVRGGASTAIEISAAELPIRDTVEFCRRAAQLLELLLRQHFMGVKTP